MSAPASSHALLELHASGIRIESERTAPLPLYREPPASAPYPVEALGDLLGPAALAIEDIVRAPVELCSQSVLAASALAVQHLADLELPTGSKRPVSLYLLSIAESGERKTTADDLAMVPIAERERELREEHPQQLCEHRNSRDLWEAARREAVRLDPNDRANALAVLGPEPMPPAPPILTTGEPTFEGLLRLLKQRESVGLFSSEGGQFVGGFAFSEEKRLNAAAGLSALWDGAPLKDVRASRQAEVIEGRLSGHLMCQPGVAATVLGDPLLRDQGLLSRLLVAAPSSRIGTRFYREPAEDSAQALERYRYRLTGALRREREQRVTIELDTAAISRWRAYADGVEARLLDAFSTVRGFASKLPEHAARLAAVILLASSPDSETLTAEDLERGIALAEWYGGEAVRLAAAAHVSAEIREAAALLEWIRLGDCVEDSLLALVDVYQRGPYSLRDKRSASAACGLLAGHGYLEPVEGGAIVRGARRRDVFRVLTEPGQ